MKNAKEVTLACGGAKCCPVVRVNVDRSLTLEDHDDGKNMTIYLSPDQARLLRDVLNDDA